MTNLIKPYIMKIDTKTKGRAILKKQKKYYTTKEFAEKIGVHPQTLRNWDKKGILNPSVTSPTGYRLYTKEQYVKYINGEYNTSDN